jgi:hypothetical protein
MLFARLWSSVDKYAEPHSICNTQEKNKARDIVLLTVTDFILRKIRVQSH